MASKITTRIIVDVKNGDVFDENRLTKINGERRKSNTGTYFLCSSKDYSEYLPFFSICDNYKFEIDKISEYRIVFKAKFYKDKDNYLDKMNNFDKYCDILVNTDYNSTNINLRQNDTRYFLRFTNNKEELVDAFRHILYGDLSSIVLEFDGNICSIYPVVKYEEKLFFD
ncbi:hypothetical protein KHQ89_04045 [Mycoplasmatota bacterium]|nr:hypothetical protein KHQ89_04045 [Mycoplasmatota bacterium]